MKDQAGEEQDVGVRKADLELDGLDEIEDGRPGDQKPVPVLGESSVGEMTDAGDLRNKKNCSLAPQLWFERLSIE